MLKISLKSTTVLAASLVMLSACGPTRDPGYVCMHDCAHYCPDGVSGDQCRHNIQLQQGDHATNNGEYYPDGGKSYYYGATPGGPVTYVTPVTPLTSDDGYTTTTTTTVEHTPY